jgi:aryl-alcohol dehydrogenase-like predicted oxidoreductase
MATTTQTTLTTQIKMADTKKSKAALKIVFGTANLGKEGNQSPTRLNTALPISTLTLTREPRIKRALYLKHITGAPQVRVHDLKDSAAMLDVFQEYGHSEVDSARIYGAGSTEECLSQLKWQERGLVMDTKLIPLRKGPFSYSHKKDGLKSGLLESLKALRTDKVDLWSLHKPDVSAFGTPFSIPLFPFHEPRDLHVFE